MSLSLKFLGAAQNVTGSSHLLEVDGLRLMVDCGFYQERQYKARNWEPFPQAPSSVDAVLLTHAHLDHCGLLPKFVREGFRGPIYCTEATADITRIVLKDSARIQEEDVAYKRKRHAREGRTGPHPLVPLYTQEDAEACFGAFHPVRFDQPVSVGKGVEAIFRVAGHILGSSTITVTATDGAETRSILFSGDVGRWDSPILKDPVQVEEADHVVCESTYGNRVHEDVETVPGKLENIIKETCKAGGNIVIPSFAVERTQEVLYRLGGLLSEKRIPALPVFVDSPMAIRVTEVFRNHTELFDAGASDRIREGNHPCDFPGLTMSRSVDESKAINEVKTPVIVIAGSGMCTGGRVKHHLVQNIDRPESTILFVGYQAHGTLGRIIIEGTKEVRIFGQERRVRARIAKINGFSGHADRNELLRWLSGLKTAPRQVFLTHGEPKSSQSFAELIRKEKGWRVSVPEYLDQQSLD